MTRTTVQRYMWLCRMSGSNKLSNLNDSTLRHSPFVRHLRRVPCKQNLDTNVVIIITFYFNRCCSSSCCCLNNCLFQRDGEGTSTYNSYIVTWRQRSRWCLCLCFVTLSSPHDTLESSYIIRYFICVGHSHHFHWSSNTCYIDVQVYTCIITLFVYFKLWSEPIKRGRCASEYNSWGKSVSEFCCCWY